MPERIAPQMHIENVEEKKTRLNKSWRNKEKTIEVDGEKYNLEDCYDHEIERRQKAFETASRIAEQIPPGKYILFVDSVDKNQGTTAHPEFPLIDEDRRKKMFQAETGSDDLNQDFQPENMRYRLGFKKGDNRFQVFKSFDDEVPTDLKNCVAVVYSGSAINVFEETNERNLITREKVLKIINEADKSVLPQLGICFGGQVLAYSHGAEIEKITDQNGNPIRVVGVTGIRKTEAAIENPFVKEIRKTVSSPQNHGQQINPKSLEKTTAEILAVSVDNQAPEIVFFPPYTYCSQSHIEGGSARNDVVGSLTRKETDPEENFFKNNCAEAGEIIFPKFLETTVKFAKSKE